MSGRLQAAVARLAPALAEFEPGHVWLAGAGPGGLGCLTLEVVAALAEADAVVYDALVDPATLRAADGAELHFVGKRERGAVDRAGGDQRPARPARDRRARGCCG